jgi:hypothetical protein
VPEQRFGLPSDAQRVCANGLDIEIIQVIQLVIAMTTRVKCCFEPDKTIWHHLDLSFERKALGATYSSPHIILSTRFMPISMLSKKASLSSSMVSQLAAHSSSVPAHREQRPPTKDRHSAPDPHVGHCRNHSKPSSTDVKMDRSLAATLALWSSNSMRTTVSGVTGFIGIRTDVAKQRLVHTFRTCPDIDRPIFH